MKNDYCTGYKDGYAEAIDDVKCLLRACNDIRITKEVMSIIDQLIPMNQYVMEIKNENCRANIKC